MEERQIWERLPDEPLLWFQRFERFRLMTPTRSISRVFCEERDKKKQEKTRTNAGPEWYRAAEQWRWNERAAAWDAVQTKHLEQTIESEKARVLLEGYALMHRRVARLNAEVEQLLAYAQDEKRVWNPDVKAVGFERVDLVQFNDALFREIRAHFDDIAKELGHRVKKQEVEHSWADTLDAEYDSLLSDLGGLPDAGQKQAADKASETTSS